MPTTSQVDDAAKLIVSHEFPWCRARLMHALASAAEQGVLEQVLDELLPPGNGRGEWDGAETGEEIAASIAVALEKNGWTRNAQQDPECRGCQHGVCPRHPTK